MPSFNLLDEKWIPCLSLKGENHEKSLREALIEARSIREIFDTSPLVTAALHRLMLAILWRVFPVESLADWKAIWKAGKFDQDRLDQYFDQWRERFDLLHPIHPFYQLGNLTLTKRAPLKRLGWEFAAGNNGTLFDHSSDDDRPAISPPTVARWIVATQCFAASAGRGEAGQLHTKDSPWSRGAVLLMLGDNLFETLALNLLSLYRDDFPKSASDLPAWEKDPVWSPQHDQTPDGMHDYLTWQSRAVKLLPENNGELRECYFAQGRAISEEFNIEPAYAYKRDLKIGLRPWQFDEGRVLWRDSHSLFNLSDDAPFQLPRALLHLAGLVKEKTLNRHHLYRLQVMGQSLESGQPTIRFWRNERLPVSPDYLNQKPLLEKLSEAITTCEKVAEILNQGIYTLARSMLEYISDRKPDKKDIKQLIEHWRIEAFYWSRLDAPFKQLLIQLPDDVSEDEDGEPVYGQNTLPNWLEALRESAIDSFDLATRSLAGSSRTLKAVVDADRVFRGKLQVLLNGRQDNQSQTITTGGQK